MHEDNTRPGRRGWRRLLLGAVAVVTALIAFAAPASAASVSGGTLTITPISNGALRLTYNGHTYTCYRGDLCQYKTSFAAYYKCQTIANSSTATGWSVNNQVNPGGTAYLHPRSGYTGLQQPVRTANAIYWSRVSSVTTCT